MKTRPDFFLFLNPQLNNSTSDFIYIGKNYIAHLKNSS